MGNHDVTLLKTSSEDHMESPLGVHMLDLDCHANASLFIEGNNIEDILVAEKEQSTFYTSSGAEIKGGTNCGKRQSIANS